MAVASVSAVLEKISYLLIEEAKFLHGVKNQVTELQTELMRMECFLEDADAIRYKNRRLRNWIVEIKELAYKSEIELDKFLLGVQSRRGSGFRGKVRRFAYFFNELIALRKVGLEIESIKDKLNNFSTRFQIYGIRDLSSRSEASSGSRYDKLLMKRRTYADDVEDDFVDLPDVTRGLVEDLLCQKKQYRAVSICGIGGLGKTTLAKKIYQHKDVRDHFDAFAWAYVSQQPKRNEILRGILTELMPKEEKPPKEKKPPKEEGDIIKQLLEIQATKKCLVVLDDVWSKDAWDIIKAAFPKTDEMGSIILLTTRNEALVQHIDPQGLLKEPPRTNPVQSWDLFLKKAFPRVKDRESRITNEQMELGNNMLKHCGGLPLAIAVLGGLLTRKHTLDEWKIVNKNIDLYLRGENVFLGQTGEVMEMLALSYHELPYWLKPCFLYLGNFPEDCEILAYVLYQLWIAEGFISLDEERRREEETLMDVAESYLGELAQRSMVQVQIIKVEDIKFDDKNFGRFKSCRLHDLMREMCLLMVKEENFLKVIEHGQSSERQSRSSFSSSTLSGKIHRLAIHGNENINPSNICIEQEKNIQAVLFFDRYNRCREEFVSHLPKNFKLVRVMHFEEFGGVELPKAVGDLIHLKYFRLATDTSSFLFNIFFIDRLKLPSSIGNLRYLQTLDLSSSDLLIIPNVLWKLKQLMHLYFPREGMWEPAKCDKLRLDGLDKLEVLHQFDSKILVVEDLQKLINLRSLTGAWIAKNRQDLVAFVNYLTREQLLLRHSALRIGEIDFCTEDRLALLKQIFFECHPLHELSISGRIRELPEYQESFHSSLTHLSLKDAELEEDPMARLEKLPNLAVLFLYNSYIGKEMVCSVQGFPRLKKLMLWKLEHLEDWRVDEEAMPNLSYLSIWRCSKLKMVPNGLRCITTLQELSILWMPQAFVDRLKSPDGVDFDKVSHIPSIRVENTCTDSDNDEEYQGADNNEEQQETTESSVE